MRARIAAAMLLASGPSLGALSDAFDQGSAFGRARNPSTVEQLRQASPASTVPGYAGAPGETSYFGTPSLGANASARAGACAANANGAADPQCAAIHFSQTNASRRPTFNIPATDPLLARAKTITSDPHAIAGHLAGTYSGCTTRTTTTPDLFETLLCHEYRVLERQTCSKTLSVTVTDHGLDCTPGILITPNPRIVFIRPYVFVGAVCADEIRFQWTYGYSECNGSGDSIYVTTTVPTDAPVRMPINLGCGGEYFLEGSCPQGRCDYRVGIPAACDHWCGSRCCEGYRDEETLTTFNFTRPKRTYTIADTWINQCAAYEARLP